MVEVFSSPSCVACRQSKKFLERNGVSYQEKMVTDEENLSFVKNLGYSSLPVVVAPNGEHWSGYQPDKLNSLV